MSKHDGSVHGNGLSDGHVGQGDHVRSPSDAYLEWSLEGRFIETWEGPSGVGWLEVGRQNPSENRITLNSSTETLLLALKA